MANNSDKVRSQIGSVFYSAFPDDSYVPPLLSEFTLIFPISFNSAFEFGQPVFLPAGRGRCMRAALMAMPEAAMNENRNVVFWKHDIRFPGQVVAMQAKPEAKLVEKGTDPLFRRRIGRAHTTHDGASLFWRKCIHRAIPLRSSSWGQSRTGR